MKTFFGRIWEFCWHLVFWLLRVILNKWSIRNKVVIIVVSVVCMVMTIAGVIFIVDIMDLITGRQSDWWGKIKFGTAVYLMVGIIANGASINAWGEKARFL